MAKDDIYLGGGNRRLCHLHWSAYDKDLLRWKNLLGLKSSGHRISAAAGGENELDIEALAGAPRTGAEARVF